MSNQLKIVMAQLNLTVGDISGNLEKHIQSATYARDHLSADVIVFPELSLTGYPPEDLLLRQSFIDDAHAALQKCLADIKNIYCVIGHPHATVNGIYNACSLIYNGKILGSYAKQHLPNYDVFDEYRYFTPGNTPCVVPIKGILTGLVICEDLWNLGPVKQAAISGARLILSPNASPFETNKHEQRIKALHKQIMDERLPIVYVNQVGGQDELLFDGGSMVMDEEGNPAQFAGFFNESLFPVNITFSTTQSFVTPGEINIPNPVQRIYQGLVTGVRDYINKNHFPGVLIGLSGGIDSALTFAIAVDALGKDRVTGVLMPSQFTADISNEDALALASAFDVKTISIPIKAAYEQFLDTLSPTFKDTKLDITEENLQSRCRAVILMALSNKTGNLVLTTGNRSEIAVGYCTLYGDMAGGYAVLKDIPKLLVYQLANYRNHISQVIPHRTIERPPTAELAPGQKDEDTLPPYAILDEILLRYLNQGKRIEEIIADGFDRDIVMKTVKMIHRNEYKRKQSALGPRINIKSFGKDWRYPVTNGYKG